MKNKMKSIVIITLLLLSLCAALVVGCSLQQNKEKETVVTPLEKEESKAISFNIIGGKDVMPLAGNCGPHEYAFSSNGNQIPDYMSDEIFQLIQESGMNMISYSEAYSYSHPDFIEDMLTQCDKYELGFFPWDNYINYKRGEGSLTATMIGERIAQYYDHDSWCGAYIHDEPQTSYYGALDESTYVDKFTQMAQAIHTELDLISYANVAPIQSTSKEHMEAWERMAVEYLETWNPKIFMWDMYPFMPKYKENMLDYITNLSLVRKYAYQYDIPFWTFIQVGNNFTETANKGQPQETVLPYTPTEAQFDWNINTALAYGSQGLQFYTLIQPTWDSLETDGGLDTYRHGFIGLLGNKTLWYYYMQTMAEHIKVIDEVLMNSVNKGVIIKGEKAEEDFKVAECVLKGEKFQELQAVDVDGDVMIGCFNYNGKTALYVVNYDWDYAQYITLDFNAKHNITVTQNAEKSYIKTDSVTLDMAAGEGVLLVID